MIVQVLSDLYLYKNEDYVITVNPNTDVLIFAGNIDIITKNNNVYNMNFLNTVKDILNTHKNINIIYVFGNNEYYGHDYNDIVEYVKTINIPRLYILNNKSIVIDNVKFIGSTLWTDIPMKYNLTKQSNNYKSIEYNKKDITIKDTNELFDNSVEYILDELKTAYQSVVITYYAPSFHCLNETTQNSAIKHLYASELDIVIKHYSGTLTHWFCGGNIGTYDFFIDDTKIIYNSLCYRKNHYFIDMYTEKI